MLPMLPMLPGRIFKPLPQAVATNRDLAAADYKRFKALKEQNFISGAELERRETTLKAAQAQVDQAQSQLNVQDTGQSIAQGFGAYRVDVAGAVEESSKGSLSILAGVPLMLFLTFTLLMLQLQSFSRAMLVFLTGLLGIAGVAGALLLLGRSFGFVALLGVIALMGMIQRNSALFGARWRWPSWAD